MIPLWEIVYYLLIAAGTVVVSFVLGAVLYGVAAGLCRLIEIYVERKSR